MRERAEGIVSTRIHSHKTVARSTSKATSGDIERGRKMYLKEYG